ncbi:hypothetical protein ANN_01330 [Periplaneta americana]|uniref:Tyr recombinase domain-containing protein n=1 Tax=Periplaneta americana TaxID=6978 RepID=A0ABQ8TT91_PERAM|nr:hypothetical protein ANN_01330 [Periplaneta americana]
MLLIYGEGRKNSRGAKRLYQEYCRNRWQPVHTTFKKVERRLRVTGIYCFHIQDRGLFVPGALKKRFWSIIKTILPLAQELLHMAWMQTIDAPDDRYLLVKVVAVMGIGGACRCDELLQLRLEDVE